MPCTRSSRLDLCRYTVVLYGSASLQTDISVGRPSWQTSYIAGIVLSNGRASVHVLCECLHTNTSQELHNLAIRRHPAPCQTETTSPANAMLITGTLDTCP